MKLNPGFLTYAVGNEYYIVSTAGTEFNGIVKSNRTAAFIAECLKNETTEAEIVDRVCDEFADADRATVERDVKAVIDKLRGIGAIED